jgi:tRNA-Thr(GGU) m(6)t(6)A37 methyltransferase TsaA
MRRRIVALAIVAAALSGRETAWPLDLTGKWRFTSPSVQPGIVEMTQSGITLSFTYEIQMSGNVIAGSPFSHYGVSGPDAWLEVAPGVAQGLQGIAVGDEIIVITWFHRSRRDVLKVHPRWDKRLPLTGVFATRSPDRPNPLGLHHVRVVEIVGNRLRVGPIEAIDGTPVVDVKPALAGIEDS